MPTNMTTTISSSQSVAKSLTIFSLTKITYPTCTSSCAALSAVILCQAARRGAARHSKPDTALHGVGSTEMTATAVATRHNAPPPSPYIAAALGRSFLGQQASGCLGKRGGKHGRRWRYTCAANGGGLAVRGRHTGGPRAAAASSN